MSFVEKHEMNGNEVVHKCENYVKDAGGGLKISFFMTSFINGPNRV